MQKDMKAFSSLQRQAQPAVLLQAVARGFLVRKRLAKFSKEAVNRIRVRNVKYLQLLRIERQYSGQLQSIVKVRTGLFPLSTDELAEHSVLSWC